MMALLGKRNKRSKTKTSAAATPVDGMSHFLALKNTLHDSISAVGNAIDDARKNREENSTVAVEWETRIAEVNSIQTENKNAQRSLGILLREATNRATHHKEASAKYAETVELLGAQLDEMLATMNNMNEYQRNYELEKRLKQIAVAGPLNSASPSIDFDLKEISRLVHTANAMVELKERS